MTFEMYSPANQLAGYFSPAQVYCVHSSLNVTCMLHSLFIEEYKPKLHEFRSVRKQYELHVIV